ncbi:MAG: thioredoxin domain-containing protein [Thiothrix sp.]|nr:MAG: thioredoxin domain-containing protein [Thiothrix sp.]
MPNQLATETSPYLQQHADNPVEWYPWGEQALRMAREQNKPILLSIGYSACHWCHVMAHESFEDESTAEVMNDLFINIKVDQEERPDLDKIYQTAHYMITQRNGGWPLTMFLNPENQIPFFGGTYFPDKPRHGLPSFKDLLQQVSGFYLNKSKDVAEQNQSLASALGDIYQQAEKSEIPGTIVLDMARSQLTQQFDETHGGFGHAPKFPHPTHIERLLRHWENSGRSDHQALEMAGLTLEKMALGGLYDQLGGGFSRYSTDELWMIPHFEKMLYDNGPLLALYSQASVATDNQLFQRIANETASWVMREMQAPQGGYFSTLDADSEGEEGKFYVWTPQETQQLLDEKEYAILSRRYGLDRKANFEGNWHLHAYEGLEELAENLNLGIDEVESTLNHARNKLLTHRSKRIWPGKDEKILTAWNGLMIKGMAIAARHLNKPEYADSATRALNFVKNSLWKNNRLLAISKDSKAHLNAYLDDYAFILDGILELLQTRWRSEDLDFALQLADVLIDQFEDKQHGGFYFTSDDHEQLIQRPKIYADEATPSGNGIVACSLARLGYLCGETRYIDAAEHCLQSASTPMKQAPAAHGSLLNALEEYLNPSEITILRGQSEAIESWQSLFNQNYKPSKLSFAIPADHPDLLESLANKQVHGDVVAYQCKGTSCSAPITRLDEFKEKHNLF